MDDLEFRRRCLADPHDTAEDFIHKCREAPEYAQHAEEQIRFDAVIRATVFGVSPPPGLADRILARNHGRPRSRTSDTWRYLAVAASLFLVIGLGWLVQHERVDLPHTVLAHIYAELDHLNEAGGYSREELATILAEAGSELRGNLGSVRYAGTCHIRRDEGAHLIVQGERGPVTVLLMPGEDIGNRQTVSDQRFHGVIVPTPNGSMAIVGERREPIERYEQRIRSAVNWRV